MCVALTGKVIEVHPRTATVDFNGSRIEAMSGLLKVEPGDKVLVHAGCILQKISEDYVDELEELMKE